MIPVCGFYFVSAGVLQEGRTVLMRIAFEGNEAVPMLLALIDAGCDIHARDKVAPATLATASSSLRNNPFMPKVIAHVDL